MSVNSLPKTVTRQRRVCDFWSRALLRMSPAWVRFLVYNTGLVQYRWTGLDNDSGSTKNARLENRKLFKTLFKLLYLYLRFPPLQIRTCVFRTCIFHPCIFVLTYSVLAYSIPRYSRFPYLRFQSPRRCKSRGEVTAGYGRGVVYRGRALSDCRSKTSDMEIGTAPGRCAVCACTLCLKKTRHQTLAHNFPKC